MSFFWLSCPIIGFLFLLCYFRWTYFKFLDVCLISMGGCHYHSSLSLYRHVWYPTKDYRDFFLAFIHFTKEFKDDSWCLYHMKSDRKNLDHFSYIFMLELSILFFLYIKASISCTLAVFWNITLFVMFQFVGHTDATFRVKALT